MIKHNKWKLLITSVIILLPILVGLILWNDLPEQLPTHWGGDGNVDGWSPKLFAVVGSPLLILAVHWLCIWITAKDHKNRDQSAKIYGAVLWVSPVLSFFVCGITYATALGKSLSMGLSIFSLMGLLFIVLGNYMPKCRPNRTIGIKVIWALANEENWNATHRFGGKVFVICGCLLMTVVFLPETVAMWVLMPVTLLMILIPIIYSYVYYRRQVQEGRAPEKATISMTKGERAVSRVVWVVLAIMLMGIVILCMTGDVTLQYGEESFTVESTYWTDLSLAYAEIDEIEFRENGDAGSRTNGFGSPRLSLGYFNNEEFGDYTRYSYTGQEACVVLRVKGDVLVLNGKTAEQTREIYQRLLEKMK